MSRIVASALAAGRDGPARGLLGWAERGLLPDAAVRYGIRRLCARRLQEEMQGGPEAQARRFQERIEMLRKSPVAIHTDAANEQHYELPPAFFQHCLGRRMKYSGCFYPRGDESLDEAEEKMLRLYEERGQLTDGQDILELGCGWGSLTLWMAERYPNARITAVSNSRAQRAYIEAQCGVRSLVNVRVVTADVNRLQLEAARFDRCVSIEMFEHMRNYEALLGRIAQWLSPSGKLFVHLFCHRTAMYPFETDGAGDWMGRHFFTGGLMPAADTLLWFQRDLRIEDRWLVDGTHYARTAKHWLERQDANREPVLRALAQVRSADDAPLLAQRWRMFWMACAETFGYGGGRQWLVAHFRFAKER